MPVMGYSKTINYCGIACFGLCRRSRDLVSGNKLSHIRMSRFRRSMMAFCPCDVACMTDPISKIFMPVGPK